MSVSSLLSMAAVGLALCSVWPDPHHLCGGRGPDQKLWRADLGDPSCLCYSSVLWCSESTGSAPVSFRKVREFLQVLAETV